MRNKLIAAGVGAFGSGMLWGWAIAGDLMEQKMKSNQLILVELLERKTRDLEGARSLLLTSPRTPSEDEVPWVPISGSKETIQHLDSSASAVETPDSPDEVVEEDEDITPGETLEQTRSNLQAQIDKYRPDEVHDFSNIVMAHDEVNDVPPFVISRDLFASDTEEGDDYQKTTITYFTRENVLLDEDDELIEDLTATIGSESLRRFGDDSGDADTVFVRNRRLQTDFEVVRETEMPVPSHISFGMSREEFEVNRAAGNINFRDGAM